VKQQLGQERQVGSLPFFLQPAANPCLRRSAKPPIGAQSLA